MDCLPAPIISANNVINHPKVSAFIKICNSTVIEFGVVFGGMLDDV
jgi:hypothetical protein